jgi:hypothetical protein
MLQLQWQSIKEALRFAYTNNDSAISLVTRLYNALVDMSTIVASILHAFRIVGSRTILDEEWGFGWCLVQWHGFHSF